MREHDDRWRLDGEQAIAWDVRLDTRLPHGDHLEMSGRHVSMVVHYGVDARGCLEMDREVIWPTLRIARDDVRGYLIRHFSDEVAPNILINGTPFIPSTVARIRFDGVLTVEYQPLKGVVVTRTVFPALTSPSVYDVWNITPQEGKACDVQVGPLCQSEHAEGMYGRYDIDHVCTALAHTPQGYSFAVVSQACVAGKPLPALDPAEALNSRRELIANTQRNLILDTPDAVLNRMFGFAKLRAAESVFETKMGLVHSPGGGRYYGGIWANDQAEYANPFFPFLGERTANEAALNAYRIYARAATPTWEMLPSSFEMEGDIPYHAGGDRGDAAMVAYGAARYALATGDRAIAQELWPLITWCLEYCRRKLNKAGVVRSDTDELEGRFPTGDANLSTSSLYYGGLLAAANLARGLAHSSQAAGYTRRATTLRKRIEEYFGATVEGYDTYRYYDGNDVLRSWICLPLCMNINERAQATIAALFSQRLWCEDGLATQAGDTTFWDRATLYALRGVLQGGETATAMRYLQAYSRRRLLGNHVPYAVEAWPEGGQAHLSAESALYCRVITEGLFGITPTGLRQFTCLPRLPEGWTEMTLRRVKAFGATFDVSVRAHGDAPILEVTPQDGPAVRVNLSDRPVTIDLP